MQVALNCGRQCTVKTELSEYVKDGHRNLRCESVVTEGLRPLSEVEREQYEAVVSRLGPPLNPEDN